VLIGVWLNGAGEAGMYGTASGMNEWKDETSQMPGGHSSQQWYEDRSTCKDQFQKTRHKMSPSAEWVGLKEPQNFMWKYQPDRDDSCT